jgi:CBS domain containing-hemolysin-like protein
VDLDHFVNTSKQSDIEDEPEHHNIRIFQNALDFSNVRIRECMIPRTEIESIEINSSIEMLREKFVETRLSRILVYKESIDHVTGYFELKDIFKDTPDIQSGVRKLVIVPETMPASKLLKQFVDEKMNIAVVVDEFGGTSGMVTIEDIVEEIVGDIEDEHDVNEMVERIISPTEFVFSGRLELDYLNEKYHLKLPEKDDYETLAGMILFYSGSIPKYNDIIRINNLLFRVLKATSTRLDLVNLKIE